MSIKGRVQRMVKGTDVVIDGDCLQGIVDKQRVLSLALEGVFVDADLLPSECMGLLNLANEVAESLQQVIDANDRPVLDLAKAV